VGSDAKKKGFKRKPGTITKKAPRPEVEPDATPLYQEAQDMSAH